MFSWPLRTVTVEAVQQFLFLVCLVSFVEEDFFPHKPFFLKFQLNGVATTTTMTTTTMTMASLCDDFWSSARLLFSQVLIRIKNGGEKNIGHLISIGVTTSSRWEATCSTFFHMWRFLSSRGLRRRRCRRRRRRRCRHSHTCVADVVRAGETHYHNSWQLRSMTPTYFGSPNSVNLKPAPVPPYSTDF